MVLIGKGATSAGRRCCKITEEESGRQKTDQRGEGSSSPTRRYSGTLGICSNNTRVAHCCYEFGVLEPF